MIADQTRAAAPRDERELRRTSSRSRHLLTTYGPAAGIVLAGLALWELITRGFDVPHYVWPSVSLIAETIREEISDLLYHGSITLVETVLGFAIALVAGLAIGIVLHLSRKLRHGVYPLLIASQSVPTVVLAPVFVLVLGFGLAPKLAVIALFCFFPIVVGTIDGLSSVDREYIRMMLTLDATRSGIFRRVEFPAALPQIFTATRVSATYAAIGAVFGEWAGSDAGLGWQMLQAKGRLDTELVFADILFVTVMSLSLFALVSLVERMTIPWARNNSR